MEAELTQNQLNNIVSNLMAVKMYSLASCVMLFYDIVITFGEEVESIWMRKFTPFTILWFLNRYFPPLGFIVLLVSNFDNWSPEVCDRIVLFPEIVRLLMSAIIGTIFLIRLYAIYARSRVVVSIGVFLLTTELALKIWSFTDGTRLELPPGILASQCVLVGRNQIRFSFTWIAELFFDTAMFLFTLWRTIVVNRETRGTVHSLLTRIFRDGVIYFAVIFAANVVTALMFIFAPDNLKALNAAFSSLITSLMVSRLILSLRSAGGQSEISSSHGRMARVNIHAPRQYGLPHEPSGIFFAPRDDIGASKTGHFEMTSTSSSLA
ncbi:hypothetical protein BDZ97DRAFT_1789295 [Flammula alnicola]|nr:hypothetical protein BDZ97DRAFT_1789295 [Flammula alnicola]